VELVVGVVLLVVVVVEEVVVVVRDGWLADVGEVVDVAAGVDVAVDVVFVVSTGPHAATTRATARFTQSCEADPLGILHSTVAPPPAPE
jgi:hypothetical protein